MLSGTVGRGKERVREEQQGFFFASLDQPKSTMKKICGGRPWASPEDRPPKFKNWMDEHAAPAWMSAPEI